MIGRTDSYIVYSQCVYKKSEAVELAHTCSCRCLSRFLYHEADRSTRISTPPGRDSSPSQVTSPQFDRFPQQFAGTHLYTWVERGTVRVECLAQEHNTMSLARARTRTARSGVECTNHEATTPCAYNVPNLVAEGRHNHHCQLNRNLCTCITRSGCLKPD